MAPKTLNMGKGATVSTLCRVLHPSEFIRNKYPNLEKGQRLSGLVILRRELKRIRRKDVMAIVMKHEDFKDGEENRELYCLQRWVKVEKEGDKDLFFDPVAPANSESVKEEPEELPDDVQNMMEQFDRLAAEDIALAQNVFENVDDDNAPVEENLPTSAHGRGQCVYNQEWGHDGTCPRRMNNAHDNEAFIRNFPVDTTQPNHLQMFELLFPTKFIKDTMLPLLSAKVAPPPTYCEFLTWLGLWLLMSTLQGPTRRDYWSNTRVNIFCGAPFRLGEFMSRNRFEAILSAIRYTSSPAPGHKDKFWEVRDLLKAFNENMAKVFVPSYISCLDESMSFWTNKFTCPGFIFVPRKPWPFGNEYHTIACGLSGILYQLELVEGKDRPRELGKPEHENKGGPTVGLLLRLTKILHGTGKIVVLDSGFCVLKAIVELRKVGCFAAALIKKDTIGQSTLTVRQSRNTLRTRKWGV